MSSTLTRGCRLQLGLRASWVLCALLAFSGPALFAQTPAGTRIISVTTGSYEASTGAVFTFSDSIVVVVGQVAGAGIAPPRVVVGDAGLPSIMGHTLANMGNGNDSLGVTAISRHGWPTRIYRDVNGNGALDPGDALLTAPISLAMLATAEILVVVDVPNTPAVRGVTDTVDVKVTSRYDPSASASLFDVLNVRAAGVIISLHKSVDRLSAAVGDLLTYTVTYTSTGTGSATGFEITDAIPVGGSYVPGTMRLNSVSLTDRDGDDAGFFDVAGNRVVFRVGTVSAGQSGIVTFQVRVDR